MTDQSSNDRILFVSNIPRLRMSPGLTRRETEILLAIALRALPNKQIGQELWVDEATIKTHLNNIRHKAGMVKDSRALLAIALLRHGGWDEQRQQNGPLTSITLSELTTGRYDPTNWVPILRTRRRLGPREAQILSAIAAQGLPNKEIAEQLQMGEATVKTYLHRIIQYFTTEDMDVPPERTHLAVALWLHGGYEQWDKVNKRWIKVRPGWLTSPKDE
jgi:DNA-binding NarL/FixJ family response regulator